MTPANHRRFRLDAHNDTLMKLSANPTGDSSPYFDHPEHLKLEVSWPAVQRARVNGAFYAAFSPGLGSPEESHQLLLSAFKAMSTLEAEATTRGLPLKKYWGGPLNSNVKQPFMHHMVQTIEGAYAWTKDNALLLLEQYADLGIMAIAPVWNNPSAFGGGTSTDHDLTDLGRLLIEKMHQRRILLDVSHMNEKTFWSALKASCGPVIASHSGAAALRSHVRNLTDEQIEGIAATGGLVNAVFHRDFIAKDENASIHHVVAHMLYLRQRIGADHVGIGSDFDGCDTPLGLESIDRLERLDLQLKKSGIPTTERNAMLGGNLAQLLESYASERGVPQAIGFDCTLRSQRHAITHEATHFELTLTQNHKSSLPLQMPPGYPKLWVDGQQLPLHQKDLHQWSVTLDATQYQGHRLVSFLIGPQAQKRMTLLVSL